MMCLTIGSKLILISMFNYFRINSDLFIFTTILIVQGGGINET